jgi:hypothetical protein
MLRIKLSKICSYLYHKKAEEKAAAEIWEVIKLNSHSRIDIKHVFSPGTTEVIERVNNIIEAAENRRILELKKLKKRKK